MIKLGDYSYMGLVHDDYNADVEVGKFTSIANGTVFLGHCEHPPRENRNVVSTFNFAERLGFDYPPCSGRKTIIGNDVWIGENVIIVDGSYVGDGSIIGAGSVISGMVYPYSVMVGNPAKLVKHRFEIDDVLALMRIKWWDWDIELIKSRISDLQNIKNFIQKYDEKN